MPDQDQHIEAAQANEATALSLLDSSPSWAVVLAFYSALHWVDAYMAMLPLHPKDHTERDHYIQFEPLRPIYGTYRRLETRSREARYDLRPFTRSEAQTLLNNELARIRDYVRGLL
jgi:hypothetical protein